MATSGQYIHVILPLSYLSSKLMPEFERAFSSMILVTRSRSQTSVLVATACLLVTVVLLCHWGSITGVWDTGPPLPKTLIKIHPVPAGVLEESASQQDEKIFPHGRLPQDVINEVERFVFFIGWPCSGHSIVGTLIDAHPNILIAHEFFIFKRLMNNTTRTTRTEIFNGLYNRSQSNLKVGGGRQHSRKGYTLGLEGYWQGKFTTLKVIGDKAGLSTTSAYSESPENFKKLYQRLSADVLQIPIRVMQVIRNPYDMIATRGLYDRFGFHWKANGSVCTHNNKCKVHESEAQDVLRRAETIQKIRKDLDLTVLEIHNADLVQQPRQTMERICQFLDVECYEEYLDHCEEKVFGKVSKSRNLIEWTPSLLATADNMIKKYPFFQRYTFYSD